MSKDNAHSLGDSGTGSKSLASSSEGSVSSGRLSISSLQGEASRSLSSTSDTPSSGRSHSESPAPLNLARLSLSSGGDTQSAPARNNGSSEKISHSREANPLVERVAFPGKPEGNNAKSETKTAETGREASQDAPRQLSAKGDDQTKPLIESLTSLQPPARPEGLPRVFLIDASSKQQAEKALGAPPQTDKPAEAPPAPAAAERPGQISLIDRTSENPVSLEQGDKLKAGESPTIKVALTNPADTTTKPDFLVKADGTVEMFSNPTVTGQKEIVVQYERSGDSTQLTDAQKTAGGALYGYLDAQLKKIDPAMQAKIDDSQGVLRDSKLPEDVRKNLENPQTKAPESQVNPSSGLPERSGRTMQDTRRMTDGGASSSVPRRDVDDMTPPVKHIPNEADRMRAMKDTIASYTSRGDDKPYDYVSKRGERGWGVGRYGMTYGQIGSWMEGLTDEQIQELIKQGKLSPKAAENLKKMRDSIKKAKASGDDKDLDPFLQKMKSGEGTDEEMKSLVKENLPDQVQELAASDTISKISWDQANNPLAKGENGSVDPGQVALSFVLGRNITKEEVDGNPDYKKFAESARQAYRLQEQARNQKGEIINVENMSQVSSALNKMVGEQFWREAAGATEYGNKGCAIAVTRALQRMGVPIGTHLDVTGTANDMRRRGWQEVSVGEAMRSGKLFVPVNKETGSHIGLGLGNQVWENSSGQRQFVTRNMSSSSLRNSGRAFIVPIEEKKAS